jgi:hypothetical protein
MMGRQIPLVISFDGFAPGFPELMPLPARLHDHLNAFLSADSDGRRRYMRDRVRSIKARILGTLGRPEDAIPAIPFADAETDQHLREVAAGLDRARMRYRPKHTHRGDLLLIKTKVSEQWIGNKMDDPLYGWRPWVEGQLDVETVPGTHLTMFDQANQRRMAEMVMRAIDLVVERAARPLPG